jgi:outer membrane biogenesis lipoprotein LolB
VTACAFAASACAGKAIKLPSDPGTPLPDYAAIHRQLSAGCADVRTLQVDLSLSGKAGGEGLGGTLAAAFRSPNDMRLEFRVPPFHTLAFTLAANATGAMLLTRDKQVVRGARSEDLLAALTGIALAPSDLMAILTGCVVPSPSPAGGHLHAGGWASIDLAGATLYAQRSGDRWRPRAARRGTWQIEYVDWPDANRFPRRVALTSERPVAVNLRATLTDPEANAVLGDKVFVVDVPAGTEEIPLERLRQSCPLRDR